MNINFNQEVTIRLLMEWPIEGLHMKGWVVQKDARAARALVFAGCAEYVPPGTPPHPDQLEWARQIERATRHA